MWSFLTVRQSKKKTHCYAYCFSPLPFWNLCTIEWRNSNSPSSLYCVMLYLSLCFQQVHLCFSGTVFSYQHALAGKGPFLCYLSIETQHRSFCLIYFSCTKFTSHLSRLIPKKLHNTGAMTFDETVIQSNREEDWGWRTLQQSQETLQHSIKVNVKWWRWEIQSSIHV